LNVITAALVLLTITALYFGRDIFLPFALAVLLSFMLAPPVAWLRRLHMPRVAAVVLVVTAAVALIGALSVLVGSQAVNLANNLPAYQKTMQEKIRSIRTAAPGGGVIDRTTEVIQALGRELSNASPGTPATGKGAASNRAKTEPVPVRIEPPEQHPLEVVQTVIGLAGADRHRRPGDHLRFFRFIGTERFARPLHPVGRQRPASHHGGIERGG
jgi:hypothetical protein